MSKLKYKVTTARGANALNANPQKIGASTDKRWATGRTVKEVYRNSDGILCNRPVETWSCKCRAPDGSVWVEYTNAGRKFAERWVKGEIA